MFTGRFAALLMVTLSVLLTVVSAGSEAVAPKALLAFASADCAAPCWQGIVVGNTLATEAFTLLADNSYVESGSLHSMVAHGHGLLFWKLIDGALTSSSPTSGLAYVRDGTVVHLEFEGRFRLGDLVARLGPPAEIHVVTINIDGYREYPAVVVVYPQLGLSAVKTGGHLEQFSPEFPLDHLILQPLGSSVIPLTWSGPPISQTTQSVWSWQGFSAARYWSTSDQP
jgi:hypothetical protein